jgi:transcriptional regulator GlxA family with amidase domain
MFARILPMARRARQHTVAAVVFDGVHPFELAVPCEIFGIDRAELGVEWYRFLVTGDAPVTTSAGFTIETEHSVDALRRVDTIVVPAGTNDRQPPPPALLAALRDAHRNGARILSLCTGAFVLAAAGLLDGRRATTHWMHTDELARRYPNVEVEPDVLYIDEGQVITSAGTAAGIDACLHVVRDDHGAEVANAVARRMVVPPHRDGGQAQFVEAPVTTTADDAFHEVVEWAQEHLAEPLTVADLAHRASVSPRTFARQFRAATGTTPYRWLLRQRVFLAQRLLETTNESIERVAGLAGFGSAAALRQHFQQIVGRPPTAYRHTFRSSTTIEGGVPAKGPRLSTQ